jgi:hypothetical protein
MRNRRYLLVVTIFLLVFMLLLTGIIGMNSAKVKAQKIQEINMYHMTAENVGCENMDMNPLGQDEYIEVTKAVDDYYRALADENGYIEAYENVKVYTKLGQYRNTYIVFARYNMKISGIYTVVPGLGTLYVEQDEDGTCQVNASIEQGELKTYIAKIAQHEDVQQLLEQTTQEYEEALASDALLRERIEELQSF